MALTVTHVRMNKTRKHAPTLHVVIWAEVSELDKDLFIGLLKRTEGDASYKRRVVMDDKGYTKYQLARVRTRNGLATLEDAIAFVYAGIVEKGQLFEDRSKPQKGWRCRIEDGISKPDPDVPPQKAEVVDRRWNRAVPLKLTHPKGS